MTHDVATSWHRRAWTAVAAALLLTGLLAAGSTASVSAEGDGAVRAQGTLSDGYWMVATDGGVFSFGDADFFGSTGNITLNRPVVGMAPHPSGEGYWMVAADGGIFTFGDGATFLGSTGAMTLNRPIVGMAVTPSGGGYWLVASDGGIFAFGDAAFHGSTGDIRLNSPIVGMASTPTGAGYWLAAADGGIFAFGDAVFYGSMGGTRLNKPIVGIEAVPNGNGYYLVATDGGIFSFGKSEEDTPFLGSTGNIALNQPIVDMALAIGPQGISYWLAASDGGIFSFGPEAPFLGSMGGTPLTRPVVGIAATPFSPFAAPDLFGVLNGGQEVALDADPVGDPEAFGEVYLDLTEDELCYVIFSNFGSAGVGEATAAHIHRAPAGQTGPVVVPLVAPDENGNSQECRAVDAPILADIADNPENYYVNVHNAEFPDGAARAQLGGVVLGAVSADDEAFAFESRFPEDAFLQEALVPPAGESFAAVDYRPEDERAYFLTMTADGNLRLYALNTDATSANFLSYARIGDTEIAVTEGVTAVGADFDPVLDLLRVVTDQGDHLLVDAEDGTFEDQATTFAYTPGDTNDGDTPQLVAIAHSDNNADAEDTDLYAIDAANDSLVMVDPETGLLTTVGPLGVELADLHVSLDIDFSDVDEDAAILAVFTEVDADGAALYALNDTNGGATFVGEVDDGQQDILAAAIDAEGNG